MAAEVTRQTVIGDHVTLQRGATYKSARLGEPGPVLLGLATIHRHGGFRDANLKTYGGDSPPKFLVFPGELYVSLKDVTQTADVLGAVARFPDRFENGRLTQDTVKLTFRERAPATKRYLYWLLRTPLYRQYCRRHATGTTTLALSRESFLEYPVPPLTSGRKALLDVFDHLDDKIGSNQRVAAAAETLTQELTSRVVVVGDRTGWDASPLSEAVSVNPPVRISRGTDTPFVEMASVAPWASRPHVFARRDFSGGAKFERGDTLFARITGCIEHGKGAFVDFVDESSAGSTEFVVFRARPPLSPEAVFALSRDPNLRAHAIANMIGTSGRQRVDNSCWNTVMVSVAPASAERDGAMRLMSEAMQLGHGLWTESRTLTALRDGLLPKLASGKIRVPLSGDPEEGVGAAAEQLDREADTAA